MVGGDWNERKIVAHVRRPSDTTLAFYKIFFYKYSIYQENLYKE